MKHIIIEGGDNLGKDLLIEGILKHFKADNITIRHFGKPPKIFPEGITPLEFQFKCFWKETYLLKNIRQMEDDEYNYYENVVIWNRSHLGEYVYGQMFREEDPKELESFLYNFEIRNLINYPNETFLILLTADPKFFLSKEDGNSFSKNLKEKTRELQLFDKIFDLSQIDNKLRLQVNNGKEFKPKEQLLNSVLDIIKKVQKELI